MKVLRTASLGSNFTGSYEKTLFIHNNTTSILDLLWITGLQKSDLHKYSMTFSCSVKELWLKIRNA